MSETPASELADRIAAACAKSDCARIAELDEHDLARDTVLAYVDGLNIDELRALGRWCAAIERGRRTIGPVSDIGADAIDDAMLYLHLQKGTKQR